MNTLSTCLRFYKRDLADKIRANDPKIRSRLKIAYDDLIRSSTTQRLSEFDHLVEKIEFYSPGIAIKLVNGDTDEDVALKSPYNLFVGGNKLGRGVTIKNLLVSYYGRNPKSPQADTVLQHARMFGYRRNDLDFLRLYLPQQLLTTFQAIHKMETGLRELIANKQSEEFRGIYLEGNVKATRRNILAPGCLGVYSAGSNYNIAQILRVPDSDEAVCEIDNILRSVGNKSSELFPISTVLKLVRMIKGDDRYAQQMWNADAIEQSLIQIEKLTGRNTAHIYVDRDRKGRATRRENQGILDGGEKANVPGNELALFMLRMAPDEDGNTGWWPQIRFPDGNYAFAFAV